VKYFLLVYDRGLQRILDGPRPYAFDARDQALADRERAISDNIVNPDIEVVLLGADSVGELRKTHARYFQTSAEIASAR
jgi:hypothetical protein